MTTNPLIKRELRERWRRKQAFWLVAVYAALHSVFAYYVLRGLPESDLSSSRHAAAEYGRVSFVVLTGLQLMLWAMVTPALMAPTIAGEREHGLLESLQLSPLTATQIVTGKLCAALLFCLMLLVVSLPCSALCFLIGGVTPVEYVAAIGFQIVTATTCASIGLWCSAWSRRANIALRSAFALVVIWSGASFYYFAITRWPGVLPFFLRGPSTAGGNAFYEFFGSSNPIVAIVSLYYPAQFTLPSAFPWPTWLGSLILQGLFSFLLIVSSRRAVFRPLGETYWIESKKRKKRKGGQGNEQPATNETTPKKTPLGWWELPLGNWLPSGNPVLQREVRGKFRMRQVPPVVIVFEALLGAVVLYFYLKTLWTAWFDAPARPFVWWGLAFFGLIVLMFACAIMGATSLARERESGTWEGLSLSLITPGQIIAGKFGAAMFACGVFSLPFLPLLLPCIKWTFKPVPTSAITPAVAAGTILILIGTAASFTAWGMLCSWIGKRVAPAVSWTLASLFLIEIVIPISWSVISTRSTDNLPYWNAMAAMIDTTLMRNGATKFISVPLGYGLISALVTLVLLQTVRHLVQRDMRQ